MDSDFCVLAVVVCGSLESLCQFFHFFHVVFFTFRTSYGLRNCDSNFYADRYILAIFNFLFLMPFFNFVGNLGV